MCGIAGFHSLNGKAVDKAGLLADYLLLEMEQRGRDATGFIALSPSGEKVMDKYTVPASKFVYGRERFPAPRSILLHTRFATTGNRTAVMDAHPHLSGSTAAVHNGTIYNADELFQVFDLPRNARVDSEVIPALVEYAGWDKAEDALALMEGGAATALLDVTKPGEMILARLRSYPLCWTKVNGMVVFASTAIAIRRAWHRAYGKELKTEINSMVPGEVLRLNGKITKSEIPGVFGVETERVWAQRKTRGGDLLDTPSKSKAKSKSPKREARSKGRAKRRGKVQHTTPLTHATSEKEQALRLEAIKRGTQPSPGEIMALIDALETARAERDEADMILDELGYDTESDSDWEEIEWSEDELEWSNPVPCECGYFDKTWKHTCIGGRAD
jgi:asparagine synthetase B (glutamine-hydrolysing)